LLRGLIGFEQRANGRHGFEQVGFALGVCGGVSLHDLHQLGPGASQRSGR